MHVSYYFFFLYKRATPWYNDVNRNISLQKKSTILRQKSYQFFFSLSLSLLLLRFFLLVCKKEDKKLDSNKLKSFAKSILLFCKKMGWGLKPSRSRHRRCSVKKGVLRNFEKFIGQHLCQSLLLEKSYRLRPATLLKKRLGHRCCPMNFAKFLRTPFLQNISGRLLLALPAPQRRRACLGKKSLLEPILERRFVLGRLKALNPLKLMGKLLWSKWNC